MSTYTVFDGMVEKPTESYREKCVDVFCIDSVDIHSIECIKDPCLVLTVSTYIVFDGMVEKPTVSVFPKLFVN